MVDEIDMSLFFANGDNIIEELSKYKCCWITFTEFGGLGLFFNHESQEFGKLEHENLNILFRSANHISTITGRNIEKLEFKELPFPSKPVRIPGCFIAAQRQIAVTYVDKIEDVLNVEESEEFLENGFTDRLVVVLSDDLPSDFSDKELKKRWNATEVVYCSHSSEIGCISGSEFQSVLFIIKDAYIGEENLTSVVSRAQYEVGIILIRTDQYWFERDDKLLTSYLSVIRSDYAVLFDQFISSTNKSTLVKWLQPTDTDGYKWRWWKIRMKIHLEREKEQMMKCIERQPISVQLQLCFAFYHLYEEYDLIPHDFDAWCDKVCDELDSIDDRTISELDLLYWSVISESFSRSTATSKSIWSVECCLDLLRKRNLLSIEINKLYPNATILHVMMDEDKTNDENAARICRLLLNCDKLEKRFLLHKYKNKNVFEITLSISYDESAFVALFSNLDRCDVFFMDYLGFVSGESEEKRREKYRKWRGDILFNVIRMKSVDAVILGLRLLKRYDYILKYELSQINGNDQTLLQCAIDERYRKEEFILDVMRLLIEAGFPNNLLLHECYHDPQ